MPLQRVRIPIGTALQHTLFYKGEALETFKAKVQDNYKKFCVLCRKYLMMIADVEMGIVFGDCSSAAENYFVVTKTLTLYYAYGKSAVIL